MSKKRLPTALRVILIAFTVLGLLYSAGVPIFEASDEVWHYPMVEHLARTWTLPVQPLEPGASSGPWRQEASQPPLYYALAAALTAWIDTSPTAAPYDIDTIRHLNPHVAAGEVMPDGSNPNLVVHNPALERFPWRGTVLAIHIARIFSVLLGTWAVYLTWALVRELFPAQPRLALITAAIHAFTPMYLFVSASVNNDNLIVPLCSLALLLMVRLVKRQEIRCKRQDASILHPASCILRHVLLGVVIGLGLLTKASAIALLPFVVATVAWEAWQHLKSRSMNHTGLLPTPYSLFPKIMLHALRNLALVLLPALAISGWWFARNFRLYGDWLGLNAFYAVLGTRAVTADLAQLWAERFAFAAGYWGNFGGLNITMPTWIYTVLNLFAILAGIAAVVGFGLWAVSPKSKVQSYQSPVTNHQSLITNPQSPVTNLWPFAWDELTAARALAWAWPVAVFVSWMQWATITWSSQGRLIFSALPMWSLALALPFKMQEARSKKQNTSIQLLASAFPPRFPLRSLPDRLARVDRPGVHAAASNACHADHPTLARGFRRCPAADRLCDRRTQHHAR